MDAEPEGVAGSPFPALLPAAFQGFYSAERNNKMRWMIWHM